MGRKLYAIGPFDAFVSQLGRDGWEMTGTLATCELFGNYLFDLRPDREE